MGTAVHRGNHLYNLFTYIVFAVHMIGVMAFTKTKFVRSCYFLTNLNDSKSQHIFFVALESLTIKSGAAIVSSRSLVSSLLAGWFLVCCPPQRIIWQDKRPSSVLSTFTLLFLAAVFSFISGLVYRNTGNQRHVCDWEYCLC